MSTKKTHKAGPPELKPFDVAEHLDSPEVIAAYLNEAFASGSTAFISAALGDVARAKGIGEIAERAKLNRQQLYKTLSQEGNPSLDTLLRVLETLDLKLATVSTKKPPKKAPAKRRGRYVQIPMDPRPVGD